MNTNDFTPQLPLYPSLLPHAWTDTFTKERFGLDVTALEAIAVKLYAIICDTDIKSPILQRHSSFGPGMGKPIMQLPGLVGKVAHQSCVEPASATSTIIRRIAPVWSQRPVLELLTVLMEVARQARETMAPEARTSFRDLLVTKFFPGLLVMLVSRRAGCELEMRQAVVLVPRQPPQGGAQGAQVDRAVDSRCPALAQRLAQQTARDRQGMVNDNVRRVIQDLRDLLQVQGRAAVAGPRRVARSQPRHSVAGADNTPAPRRGRPAARPVAARPVAQGQPQQSSTRADNAANARQARAAARLMAQRRARNARLARGQAS